MIDEMKQMNDANGDMKERTLDVIIGRNPVIEALKSGKSIDTIYIVGEPAGMVGRICAMAKQQNIVVKQVDDRKLSNLAEGGNHQGIVAVGACAEYVSVSDILAAAKAKQEQPFIIIADEIEDPHNLGALIRTAEAAGAHGLIIPKRRSASLNGTVYKTSAGAASWLPVARVANLASAIEELKAAGVWIYAADAAGESFERADMTGSIALVIGSEGNGIGRLIRERCDFFVKLPMLGKITSLNASVAGGILMYEVLRRRITKGQ